MSIRKVIRINFLIIISILLTSCVNQYTYNDISYTSSKEALEAHRAGLIQIEKELKEVTLIPTGGAAIITPTKATCEALGIKRKGSPDKELIDYLGTFLEEDFAYFSKFLEKGKVFASVTHFLQDFPAQYAQEIKNKYSAVIYLDMKSPEQISWIIIVPPDFTPNQISMDKMANKGTPKIQSWIDDIKKKIDK